MEKKKMAKALVLTAAMAGGISIAQSFTNEVQASGCYNFKAVYIAYGGSGSFECRGAGDTCRFVPAH
jgi:hypothetical protein